MDNLSESRAGFIHSSYWESEPSAIKNNPDKSPHWQSRACQLLPYKRRLMSQSQWGSGHRRISTTIVSSHAFWIDCVKVFYICYMLFSLMAPTWLYFCQTILLIGSSLTLYVEGEM